MHTNEAYFSRVCCWNLINTLKQLFAARIQKSKKIEEHELIAFFFAFVLLNLQVLYLYFI